MSAEAERLAEQIIEIADQHGVEAGDLARILDLELALREFAKLLPASTVDAVRAAVQPKLFWWLKDDDPPETKDDRVGSEP